MEAGSLRIRAPGESSKMAEQGQQGMDRGDRAHPIALRAKDKSWVGPVIDYKDIDILRKYLTASHKLMSRKRAGTTAQQQQALKIAVKRARFLALVPFSGT